jgi:integrase/recombinase XerD
MEKILKDYNYYLRMERAMSQNTVASYCSDIERFLAFYQGSLTSIDSVSVEEFLKSRTDLSKRSQARTLSALRSFCKWLVLEGMISDNPCDKVEGPKLGYYIPEVLAVDEVLSIIDSVDVSSWMGLRDRALIEVLYGCGLRISEAVGLKVSLLYLDEGFVRIVGKGNKERLVPIGEAASDALVEYLDNRPAEFSRTDHVFLNRYGNPLSRVSAFNTVKKLALLAGVNKDISPHTFRHSFATHLIENGADIRLVQEMLGHESISTTEIYTHIDNSTWQKVILEHHPRRK